MYATPLSDCTNAALQAVNKTAAGSTAKKPSRGGTTVKVMRHNPYACLTTIAPNGSFSSPMTAEASPLQWEGEATPYESFCASYSGCYGQSPEDGTPYILHERPSTEVSRSLFCGGYSATSSAHLPPPPQPPQRQSTSADRSTASLNDSQQPHSGSTGTTPMKRVGRVYVGGRPKPVRRRHAAEVVVTLRGGDAPFQLRDVYAVFPTEVGTEALVGHYVIVEGDRGEDMGCIAAVTHTETIDGDSDGEEGQSTPNASAAAPLPKVLRLADEYDLMEFDALDAAEAEALIHCRVCVQAAKLPVAVEVERVIFQFDRQKLTVQYKSNDYVDFKALTRMLHNHYKCRIWMDQLNRAARNTAGGSSGNKNRGNRRRHNNNNNNNNNKQQH